MLLCSSDHFSFNALQRSKCVGMDQFSTTLGNCFRLEHCTTEEPKRGKASHKKSKCGGEEPHIQRASMAGFKIRIADTLESLSVFCHGLLLILSGLATYLGTRGNFVWILASGRLLFGTLHGGTKLHIQRVSSTSKERVLRGREPHIRRASMVERSPT